MAQQRSFEKTRQNFSMLFSGGPRATPLDQVEAELDALVQLGVAKLSAEWGLAKILVMDFLAYNYNSCGAYHIQAGQYRPRSSNHAELIKKDARSAERCHEKAFDLFDMSAEDIMLLPSLHPASFDEARSFPGFYPIGKVVIFTFWGLGVSKFMLQKLAESRKYLQYCIRVTAEDEQAFTWQSEASNTLHRIEKKPVTLKLQVFDANVFTMEPDLIHVKAKVVEWDSYVKPMLEEYKIWFNDEMIRGIELGRMLAALEGRIVTVQTDETGNLFRPLYLANMA